MSSINLSGKNRIVIIGYPRSGKTTLFKHLVDSGEFDDFWVSSLDDYKIHGYAQALYVMLEDLKGKDKYLVEGILGYRLLRKLAQRGLVDLKPDVIIVCSRDEAPLAKHLTMRKSLDTIWKNYLMIEKEVPVIIKFKGSTVDRIQ